MVLALTDVEKQLKRLRNKKLSLTFVHSLGLNYLILRHVKFM